MIMQNENMQIVKEFWSAYKRKGNKIKLFCGNVVKETLVRYIIERKLARFRLLKYTEDINKLII